MPAVDRMCITARFQVTDFNPLSVDMQHIANPGNASDDETADVIYARLRTEF